MVEPVTIITLGVLCLLGTIGLVNATKDEYRHGHQTKFSSYKRIVYDRAHEAHKILFSLLSNTATKKKSVRTKYRVEDPYNTGEIVWMLGDTVCFEEIADPSVFRYGMWLFYDGQSQTITMYCRNTRAVKQFSYLLELRDDSLFKLVDTWAP